ncbi:MAG: phospho-N-acetylmuramoyl-pentapeptide-transferase [Clostridium sp.]
MGDLFSNLLNPTMLFSFGIGVIVSILLGPIFIPLLHKLKFGQNIREDGPKSHLKKAGTPTMGGIIFILSIVVVMIVRRYKVSDEAMIVLYSMLAFGLIGFLDDMLKIVKKQSEGLKAWQKMALLLIFSTLLAVYGYKVIGTDLIIPFIGTNVDFGILYIPLIIIYYSAFTNAVNLTDGLDGLCTSVTVIVLTFFTLVAYKMGHYSVAVFCIGLAGALIGFLKFNAFPASVFMGDTGSLALGGALATIALILKGPWIFVLVGGIYVLETVSVVIQVTSFKLTGKRVFKMAPIHHHFEHLGWSETKIVIVFSVITTILCIIGFLAL